MTEIRIAIVLTVLMWNSTMSDHSSIPGKGCRMTLHPSPKIQADLKELFDNLPNYDDFRIRVTVLLSNRDSTIIALREQLEKEKRRVTKIKDLLWRIKVRSDHAGVPIASLANEIDNA